MSESVTIKVPARLHLGFLDIPRSSRDRFGSVGLPIEGIATELTVSRAAETQVHGGDQERILRHAATLCAHLGIKAQHRITVQSAIPSHVGLGSGTQIALAVAAALRTLHSLPLDVTHDAALLGRGSRSGIGMAAFEEGGVIVDAGKGNGGGAPTVISRIPFPEDWRIILVLDTFTQGIHGEAEIEAFRNLAPFPVATSAIICRQVLLNMMPALIEQDIAAFGSAVEAIQTEIGNYFAPAQGGIFASRPVEATLHRLAKAGAFGIGQSSWGPTGFAFAASQADAERIADGIGGRSPGTMIQIVSGRNAGADIAHTALNLVRA
ncbi:beta-ribofuranosylaminobenzene 5'-phosphate synthase family protein [Phyllobacterium lublinensis]|uniref:beta-ribofuranosylaminobenzene 5'-phosphate synthase family protein n=1 Tax=Phyllobacterium lublinensis TaxID=2875708 RepID=UPI001CC9BFE6|nr:beta-ribofuranosylaminobenzene 5'-phosphate synthase family protein [Phyllobacterium sp. 2063]MBZ9657203.1 GHMP kinase [Phyllobacterium sp. 2063]